MDEARSSPATSSRAPGLTVPIPTLPEAAWMVSQGFREAFGRHLELGEKLQSQHGVGAVPYHLLAGTAELIGHDRDAVVLRGREGGFVFC